MRRVAISMVLGTMLLLGIIASPAQAGSAARSNSGRAVHTGKVGHLARPASIASFKAISSPVAKYTSKTCVIDLSAIADFTPVSSVSGCGVTVTFSSTMEKRSVPNSWATWGSPPDTESATPNILYSAGATSITLTSSSKHRRIGVEAEPDLFQVETTVATFRKGNGTAIGSVSSRRRRQRRRPAVRRQGWPA